MSLGIVSRNLSLAHDAFLQAVNLRPEWAMAWSHLGQSYMILYKQNKTFLSKSEEAFARARQLDPNLGHALYLTVHLRVLLSKWSGLNSLISEMEKSVTAAIDQNSLNDAALLWVQLLVYPLSDAVISRAFGVKAHLVASAVATLERPKLQPIQTTMKNPRALRVGYMSADFKRHPVAFLFQVKKKFGNS